MRRDSKQRRTFLNYENSIRQSCYRPFVKQWLYYNFVLISNTYQIPKMFPENPKVNIRENNKLDHATPYSTHDSPLTTLHSRLSEINPAIIVPDKINDEFTILMMNIIPDSSIISH